MSDPTTTFRAIITATDKASPVLDRIGAKIRAVGAYAELSAKSAAANPWGKAAEQQLSLFTRASNAAHAAGAKLGSIGAPFKHAIHPIKELGHHTSELGEKLRGLGEKVGEILPMFGALGGAASIAGIFELVHRVSESFSQLARSALQIGVTTQAMQQLQYAAKMTDTPIEAMQKGLFRLGRVIGDAAAGKGKDAAALFRHLGIGLKDANGHLVSSTVLLPKLQEAFAKTTDVTMRQRMAFALFSRAGLEMLPFLMASREDMAEWSDQAARMVYPFTKEDGENLEGFKRGWIGLTASAGGFLDEVGARLAPILTPVVDKIANWVAINRDWLSTNIADAVHDLADWVMKLDFDKVVQDTRAWVTSAGELLDKIGGLKTVMITLTALLVAPRLLAAIRIFEVLSAGALRASWAIGSALVMSINAAEKAMAGFNATALKNPLIRAGMIATSFYDRATNPNANVTQEQLDAADPAKVAAAGFGKNAAGKWELNGTEIGSGPSSAWYNQPDFLSRTIGGWLGGVSLPDAGGMPDQFAPPGAGAVQPGVFDRLRGVLGGGPAQNGKVDVTITLDGAPPGTTMRATGSGIASEPQTDVGYSFPGMRLAH